MKSPVSVKLLAVKKQNSTVEFLPKSLNDMVFLFLEKD